jgi:hypothetical protein
MDKNMGRVAALLSQDNVENDSWHKPQAPHLQELD